MRRSNLRILLLMVCATSARAAEPPPAFGDLHRTGWNIYATRFIHAPTFDTQPIAGAEAHVLFIDGHEAESDFWPRLSVATHQAWIEVKSSEGHIIGRSAAFSFHKSDAFTGNYPPAKRAYINAGRDGARWIMKTFAQWREPRDPSEVEQLNYPALFYAAFINVLATDGSGDAIKIARNMAKFTIQTSTPADWAYPNLPLSHKPGEYLQLARASMIGSAYLKLFAATKDRALLDAANRIADTLKAKQLSDGRWYFRVNPKTGQMAEDYTSDQAEAIALFDELIEQRGRRDLIESRGSAVKWMLENPAKTHLWQGQWDDVPAKKPYTNLSFFDAALFAMHLASHGDVKTAKEIFDWIEDQFVLWENSFNTDFIAPGVMEQYGCYIPIDWHAGHFIRLCIAMHRATHEKIYLDKAKAIADSLTRVQHPDGFFATWMRRTTTQPVDFGGIWPNCTSLAAQSLMELARYLESQ